MPTNTLTDAVIKRLAPTGKARKVFDGGGLYLFVSPIGGKIWRLTYRIDGKQQTVSIGPYPEVTLAQARAKRDVLRLQIRETSERVTKRKTSQVRGVGDLVRAYWATRTELSDGYRANAVRAMEMHVIPHVGKTRPLIDSRELM